MLSAALLAALALAAPQQTFALAYKGGCKTSHPTASSTALGGCLERGTSRGALGDGEATMRWTRLYVAHSSLRNPNTESGTLVFRSSAGRAALAWKGVQEAGGARSSGSWSLVSATGRPGALLARGGTYTASWPRRGSHVFITLRWGR